VILRPDGVCIAQPAHAWVSGQLARAWEPLPPDEVCLAAAQHDLGMAEWEAAPELDPETGRPYSFLDMPLETHLALWSRAPLLALAQGRWPALLVSMHGTMLYQRRAGQPAVDGYLAAQRALQAELRASLGLREEESRHWQRLLAAWDWMSLVLCLGREDETVDLEPQLRMHHEREGDPVVVDPWPFRGPELTVACDARRLEGRFADQEQMRAALRQAPWEPLRWRLRPA
jgi:hypothetical protein